MAKHTKTPWHISTEDKRVILTGAGGKTARVVMVLGSDSITDACDEENAAFIVTAVNSHDALVAAVEFALKYHAMMSEKDNGKKLPAQLESSLRAALKLAEGESE